MRHADAVVVVIGLSLGHIFLKRRTRVYVLELVGDARAVSRLQFIHGIQRDPFDFGTNAELGKTKIMARQPFHVGTQALHIEECFVVLFDARTEPLQRYFITECFRFSVIKDTVVQPGCSHSSTRSIHRHIRARG